jgi:HSP20 family protein
MALVRWEPRGILDLRDDIDRLFDRFWRRQESGEALPTSVWYPTVDVSEREDAYEVKADLPGVSKEHIKLKIANNVLTLSGERKSEQKEGVNGDSYHRFERSYGTFTRSFSLPSAVDDGKVSASFKDGVLTVTLPKSEAAKPKAIEVN